MTMLDFARANRLTKLLRERGVAGRFSGNHNAVKTHCPAGHSYEGNNVALRYRERDGGVWVERRCRACRDRQRHPAKVRR